MPKEFSIVVPAYNEAKNITQVLSRLVELYTDRAEIIVVDDGSTDNLNDVVDKEFCLYLRHSKNLGKGEAIKTGLKSVSTDWVVFIDADGQDDPSELSLLIERAKSGADVVVGSRFLEGQERRYSKKAVQPINYFGNIALTKILQFIFGLKVTDSQASLKCFNMEFVKSIQLSASRYEIETEMLIKAAKAKLKIVEVPVHRYERKSGHSELFDVPFGRIKFAIRVFKLIIKEIKIAH